MKIYVIRHGVTRFNKRGWTNGWIDEPLIEEGELQADAAKDKLPGDIKIIYSSPLIRTSKTAEIINQRFQVPVVMSEELKEINWGSLTGKSFTEMEKEHGIEYGSDTFRRLEYDYRPFEGESIEGVRERVHRLVDRIKSDHKEGPILLVTHGGILRILEHDYNQNFIADMPNMRVVEIEV